jgi:hypothetical protein
MIRASEVNLTRPASNQVQSQGSPPAHTLARQDRSAGRIGLRCKWHDTWLCRLPGNLALLWGQSARPARLLPAGALQFPVGLLKDAAGIFANLVPPPEPCAAPDPLGRFAIEFEIQLGCQKAHANTKTLRPRFSAKPLKLADRQVVGTADKLTARRVGDHEATLRGARGPFQSFDQQVMAGSTPLWRVPVRVSTMARATTRARFAQFECASLVKPRWFPIGSATLALFDTPVSEVLCVELSEG